MAHWMVTAVRLDRVARPDVRPDGWRYCNDRNALARLHELAPNALFSTKSLGGPGHRDSVAAKVPVQADDAEEAEVRAKRLLDDGSPYIEFTRFTAEPLTREDVARHWATPSRKT